MGILGVKTTPHLACKSRPGKGWYLETPTGSHWAWRSERRTWELVFGVPLFGETAIQGLEFKKLRGLGMELYRR